MKKNVMVAITLSVLLSSTALLSGCNRYQEDFHITTIELAEEYFPKYAEGVSKIIDRYIDEYTWEQNNDDSVFSGVFYQRYVYTVSSDFHIDLVLAFHSELHAEQSSFGISLHYKETQEDYDKLKEICNTYGKMLREIGKFCGNDVPKSENTFSNLYYWAYIDYQLATKTKVGFAEWNRFINEHEGDYVQVYIEEDTQKYGISFGSAFYLSDKNVWEE
jgi:hypothetical protein